MLLCESHPLNAEIAIRLLEIVGVEVDHAANGKMGLQVFEESPIGYYNAILMDILMPEMDGIDARHRRHSRPFA